MTCFTRAGTRLFLAGEVWLEVLAADLHGAHAAFALAVPTHTGQVQGGVIVGLWVVLIGAVVGAVMTLYRLFCCF